MVSASLLQTENIAKEFARKLKPHEGSATVIALSGNLGSGKTTFTKAFASAFGIDPVSVTSPTFVIEKRFSISNHADFNTFVHIDAYRLEKPEEIERLGWKETLSDPRTIVVIEWPEHVGSALPQNAQRISFSSVDENSREIVFN